ncbi:hypothetical protein [Maridesulfovibrio frigidus]|uniref:hypothetical protein n=1 Tax=Maridesulfovibrio frigidus TaxID=340956 RepID=UPI0004E14F05|nr:hypothetical protein [Maridesulfovibrio frigidus]
MSGFGMAGDEYAGQLVGAMGSLTGMMNDYTDGQQTDRAFNSLASGNGMPKNVSQRSQSKAYAMHREREAAEQSQFNKSVRLETERLVGELQTNNWDFDAVKAPTTLAGISAFGHAADVATKFQDGKEALRKKRMGRIDKEYQDFRKVGGDALKSLDEGNFDGAVIDMKRASEMAPMPYRLTDFDQRSKTYGIEFRSDKEGGWTGTGRRLTVGQTGDAIREFLSGEKVALDGKAYNPVFAGAADRYMEATRQGNAEVMKDPSKWIPLVNKQGHLVHAVPQNSPDYSQGVQYVVLDEDNGSTSIVDSLDKLPGYVRTSVDLREKRAGLAKTGADIAHTEAQTGKVYADTGKSRADTRKTDADTQKTLAETQGLPDKQAREKVGDMRKALGDALKPFHLKGTTLLDLDTGEFTSEGNNAFNDASKLVDDYKGGQWVPKSQTDKARLKSAWQAIEIYEQVLKAGSDFVPAEDPEQRKQVDEVKLLIKQHGIQGARRILESKSEIRSKQIPAGVSQQGYGG